MAVDVLCVPNGEKPNCYRGPTHQTKLTLQNDVLSQNTKQELYIHAVSCAHRFAKNLTESKFSKEIPKLLSGKILFMIVR